MNISQGYLHPCFYTPFTDYTYCLVILLLKKTKERDAMPRLDTTILQGRRTFVQMSFLSSLLMITSQGKLFASVTPLQTLAIVQKDLFPHTFIEQSNAYKYMSLVFTHSRVSAEDKQFIRNGTKWLNEEAVYLYDEVYPRLSEIQREAVLQSIAKESWGESWIASVLRYILEACLGDPLYGINKEEFGWKWLSHESGLPRPKELYL